MFTLYGIRNCDSVHKARHWLEVNGIPHQFHDLRSEGLEPERLERWVAALGWESLLNRRSATWRRLSEERRDRLDQRRALALMQEFPTLIKRPVLDTGDRCLVGFNASEWQETLRR